MAEKWREVKPGLWVRPTADGQWEGKRFENIKAGLEAKAAMRKHVKGRIAQETAAKDCDLRLVASLPKTVFNEMNEVCKGDPEHERAFLRDHPEHLVIPANSANLPKRKIHSSKHHRRKG